MNLTPMQCAYLLALCAAPCAFAAARGRQLAVEAIQLRSFRAGPKAGFGPEVTAEEILRAMMVVRLVSYVMTTAGRQIDMYSRFQ